MTSSIELKRPRILSFANWSLQTKLITLMSAILLVSSALVLTVVSRGFAEIEADTIPEQEALGGIRSTTFDLLSEYREYILRPEESVLEEIEELKCRSPWYIPHLGG